MLFWFIKNSERIHFTVMRDEKIKKYFADFYDYIVTIQIGKKTFWGRGIDADETNSLTTACAEVVKRAALSHQKELGKKWSSNGIAAHVNFTEAKESALAELIERDAFLSHYLTKGLSRNSCCA